MWNFKKKNTQMSTFTPITLLKFITIIITAFRYFTSGLSKKKITIKGRNDLSNKMSNLQ